MSEAVWDEVDRFVDEHAVGEDAALDAAVADNAAAGLPPIAVTPSQGKLLHLLARSIGARSILEIGTLGGYSSIWLARALAPGGRLVTLEADARFAELAAANIARAGAVRTRRPARGQGARHASRARRRAARAVRFRVHRRRQGAHARLLPAGRLQMSHAGSLIVADNVMRDGSIVDPSRAEDPAVLGSRGLHELLAEERARDAPRFTATTIQTVGAKGYDGFTLALVLADETAGG